MIIILSELRIAQLFSQNERTFAGYYGNDFLDSGIYTVDNAMELF